MNRHPTQCRAQPAVRGQLGVTLVELMISMAIGLFVALAATALLVTTKSSYLTMDEDVQIQATGRYAIEILSRAVRLASYMDWNATALAVSDTGSISASFSGLDASSLKSTAPGIESPLAKSVNGSDVLAIRFWGSGMGTRGDGTMVNCAGFGTAGTTDQAAANDDRGWSIFYVAEDATGEPDLYCKYRGDSGWTSQAVARGVESFQVLYGLDTDGDGLPNRFVNATAINALDDALALAGPTAEEQSADRKRRTHWKKVVGVKLALLVRGTRSTRAANPGNEYDLFGKDYSNALSGTDSGTRIRESALPKAVQGRARHVFATTIYQLPLNRKTQAPGGAA